MAAETDFRLVLDATQDKSLLSQEGLVRRLGESLQQVLREEDLPRAVRVEVIYPDERQLTDLQQNIQKLNKVISPRGMMDRIANTAFRSMSGVEGDLKPIEIFRSDDPPTLWLGLDLASISRDDLRNFSRFLGKNAHRLS